MKRRGGNGSGLSAGVDILSILQNLKLPSFSGVLEVKHSLPGRLRLRIPSLRRNLMAAEEFKRKLLSLKGIRQVTIDLFLGTALVHYDASVLEPMLVVSAASHCFDFENSMRRHQSILNREVKNFRFAVDQSLLKHTYGILDLRAMMTVILLATLGRGFLQRSKTKFTPLNLIWWLFQSVDK